MCVTENVFIDDSSVKVGVYPRTTNYRNNARGIRLAIPYVWSGGWGNWTEDLRTPEISKVIVSGVVCAHGKAHWYFIDTLMSPDVKSWRLSGVL